MASKLTKTALLLALLSLPIGLYIQYWIISQLNADRLIWFLFFFNIPLIIIVTILSKIVEDN